MVKTIDKPTRITHQELINKPENWEDNVCHFCNTETTENRINFTYKIH